jgi:hypothetical protein
VPITRPVEVLVLVSVLTLTVAVAAGLAKGVLSLVLHLIVDQAPTTASLTR